MKNKIVNKYCSNGYSIQIIKPELSVLDRKKEDLKILKSIQKSLEIYKKIC